MAAPNLTSFLDSITAKMPNDIMQGIALVANQTVPALKRRENAASDTMNGHDLCACCSSQDSKKCGGCRGISYCSKGCQLTDLTSHKLLCRYIKDYQEPPSPDSRRAVLFPDEEAKPRFIWLPCVWVKGSFLPDLSKARELLGAPASGKVPGITQMEYDEHLKRNTGRRITLCYRDLFMADGSVRNESVMHCTNGVSGDAMRGPCIAYAARDCGDGSTVCGHFDMIDLTHVVNHFIHHLAPNYLKARVQSPAPKSSFGIEMDRQRKEAADAKMRGETVGKGERKATNMRME